MPIREFFHLMHIVDDFDEAEARFDTLLSPVTYSPKHWSDFDKRWASLSMIGPDFVLEIMEPSDAQVDRASPLPKFRNRHGQHLHSFAWFVDAPDLWGLAARIRDRGIRVIDPYRDFYKEGGRDGEAQTFFTHPKDTFGQLEFFGMSPDGGHHHRRLSPDWSTSFWRDDHPLGIENASHLTTVVSDLDRSRAFYEKILDAPAFHEETGDDRRSAFVMVGTETVVELAQPTTAGSRLRHDLAEHGEMPHAITFKVRDLDAAERHVETTGIRVADRAGDTVTLDPDDLFNAVVAFTTRRLPNDPRSSASAGSE
jgi:extradiol dioxygenase family protein